MEAGAVRPPSTSSTVLFLRGVQTLSGLVVVGLGVFQDSLCVAVEPGMLLSGELLDLLGRVLDRVLRDTCLLILGFLKVALGPLDVLSQNLEER